MGRENELGTSRQAESLVFEWSIIDPFGAAEWLAKQPLDEQMAPAMKTLAQRVAYADPDAAIAWAGRIGNDEFRTQALKIAAAEAARWSGAKAEAALRNADLGEPERHELLDMIKKVEEVR